MATLDHTPDLLRVPVDLKEQGRIFMFDSYPRGASYEPPLGYKVVWKGEWPFGISVILEWKGEQMNCSFCGRTNEESSLLTAGPIHLGEPLFICEECAWIASRKKRDHEFNRAYHLISRVVEWVENPILQKALKDFLHDQESRYNLNRTS